MQIRVANIIANDFDPEGASLNVLLISGPASGTLTQQPNGSLTYTPVPGFVGKVTIAYAVSDGLFQSNTALITVNVVLPANIPAQGGSGSGSSGGSSSIAVARLQLTVEAFNDGEAVAVASTSSGDYPALRNGISDTTVTTPISWPDIPPPVTGSKSGGSLDFLSLLGVAMLLSRRTRSVKTLIRE